MGEPAASSATGPREHLGVALQDQQAEPRYRSYVTHAPHGVFVADENGRYVEVNPAACRITGYDEAELVQLSIGDMLPSESQREGWGAFARLRETGSSVGEFPFVGKGGRRGWWSVSARKLSDNRYLGFVVDITDQKRAEADLRQAEERSRIAERRYRLLFEQCPDAVLIIEPTTTRLLEFNEILMQMLGYSAEELADLTIAKIDASETPAEVAAHVRRVLETGSDLFASRFRTKGGDVIDVTVSVRVIELDGRRLLHSVCRDITRHKQAERRLQAREALLAEALHIANVGSWELDLTSNTILWSDAIIRILGVDKDAFGCSYDAYLQLVHPDDRENVKRACIGLLANRTPYEILHRLQMANGAVKWVIGRWAPRSGAKGQASRLIGTVQDVTDRKRAEEQLVALQSQLAHACRVATMGEMAAGIAHELNQPLAAISYYAEGCLDVIRRPGQDAAVADELRRPLSEIARLTDRCGQIIRRLREFALKRPPIYQTLDARAVVGEAVSFLSHESRTARTPMGLQQDTGPLWVHADPLQIQQVVVNLVRNAIDAQASCSPDARRIDIITRKSGVEHVEIIVRDQGVGISMANAHRLFEPFFTTKQSGLGMGLKISQTIVREHGGEITHRAEPLGGTAFIVSLPAAKGADHERCGDEHTSSTCR